MSDGDPGIEVREDLRRAMRVAGSIGPSGGDRTAALATTLYSGWFAQSATARLAEAAPAFTHLVAALRAAHAASPRFEAGWAATAVLPGGGVVAQLGGEYLELEPPDYVNLERPAAPVRVGDQLAVTSRRDTIDDTNGWWITESKLGQATGSEIVRVYWNCPAHAVTQLVGGVTTVLEDAGVRYTMKCPLDAELFGRVDAVVTYVEADVFAATKDSLRKVHANIESALRPGVPPLTLPVGRGVAFAQDPANGQSFGQSRCAAVAEGLVRASDSGTTDEDAVLETIISRFAAHGISAERPFLSVDARLDLVTSW